MAVVSVRLDDELLEKLRKAGQKPGTYAALAVMEKMRRDEIRAAREFLDKHRVTFPKSAVEMIREDRDSNYGHPERGG